jgi:hypothetical protein
MVHLQDQTLRRLKHKTADPGFQRVPLTTPTHRSLLFNVGGPTHSYS